MKLLQIKTCSKFHGISYKKRTYTVHTHILLHTGGSRINILRLRILVYFIKKKFLTSYIYHFYEDFYFSQIAIVNLTFYLQYLKNSSSVFAKIARDIN